MSRWDKLHPDPNRLRMVQAAELRTAVGPLYLVEFESVHAGDSHAILAFGRGRRLPARDVVAELQVFAMNRSGWRKENRNPFGKTVVHPPLPAADDPLEVRAHRPAYVDELAERILKSAVKPYERRLQA